MTTPAPPSAAIVVVSGLTKRFGDFTAVDQIDFSVRPGEIFGFLGPNGSGKTTTIRMLLGLLPPTAGSAHILGIDITRRPDQVARRVGYMSQHFSLYPDLTAAENLSFYGRAYGLGGRGLRRRRQEVLARVGLEAEGAAQMRTANLPGGWRQRLALAAAILHRPALIFLDEPTAGVDPVSRRQFWQLLYDLAAEGTTIFVTTHYMEEAEQCHRLAFIHNGRLIADGAPGEIKQTRMTGDVLEIRCEQPQIALAALRQAGLPDVALYGRRIHLVAPDLAARRAELAALLAPAGLHSLQIIPPSLEDVFIANVR